MRQSWRPESNFDAQSQVLTGNRAQQPPQLDGSAPDIITSNITSTSARIGGAPGSQDNELGSHNGGDGNSSSKRGRNSGIRMQLPPIHRMVTDIVTPKEALESLRGPYNFKAVGGTSHKGLSAPLISSPSSGKAAPASIPSMLYPPAQNTGMASFSVANTAATTTATAARRNETESDLSRGMRRERKHRHRRNRELSERGPSDNYSSSRSISSGYSSSDGEQSAGAGKHSPGAGAGAGAGAGVDANRSSADRLDEGGLLQPTASSRARRQRHYSHTDQPATVANNAGGLHTDERRMSLSHHSSSDANSNDNGDDGNDRCNRMQGLECSGNSRSLGGPASPSSGSPADSLSSIDNASMLSESTRATSQSGSSSQSVRNLHHQQMKPGYPTSDTNPSCNDSHNMGNQPGHLHLITLEPSCAEARVPQMPQLHMAGFLVDSVIGTTTPTATTTATPTSPLRDLQRNQNSQSQSQSCAHQQPSQLQREQQQHNDEQQVQQGKLLSHYVSSFGLQASAYGQQQSPELVYPSYSVWLKLRQERAEQEAHIPRSSVPSTVAGGVQGGQLFREDAPLEVPVKRRINLPKNVTNILRGWLSEHVDNPYPTEEDKQRLMRETGLTVVQLSNWFINARRRVLPPSHRRSRSRQHRA